MTARPDTSVVKRCSRCKETLPRETFGHQKTTFDGLRAYCRPCDQKRADEWRQKNKPTVNGLARKWRAKNPERAADHNLKKSRGVPLGTYRAMLDAQGGKCAICGSDHPGPKKRFHLDHCHTTGKVRSLLCHKCNLGIGLLNHDIQVLRRAIEYLT